MHGENLKLVQG